MENETNSKSKNCPQCGAHPRKVFDLQIRIEQLEDAQKNLLEKIEELESFKDFEFLDAEFLETSE